MNCTGSTLATRSWATDEVDQVDQVVDRRPGGEGQPGRADLDALAAKEHDGLGHLGHRVALVEVFEDACRSPTRRADTMKAQPAAASSGRASRWARMCSTLVVQSKVSWG